MATENFTALPVATAEAEANQNPTAQIPANPTLLYRNGYKVVTENDGKIIYTINKEGKKHGYYRETGEGDALIETDYQDGEMLFYRSTNMNGLYKQEFDFISKTFKWWYNRDQLFEIGTLEPGGVFVNNHKRITKKRWDEHGRLLYPWVPENKDLPRMTYAEANLAPGADPQ